MYVRGSGLNSTATPKRAESILGNGWRNAVARATVLRLKDGDVTQVRLDTEEVLWVLPQFFTKQPTEDETRPGVWILGGEEAIDLGSDEEREDDRREEGEFEGSTSARHQRSERGWVRTHITQDQRTQDGYGRTNHGQMRGLDAALRGDVWAYLWAFIPVAALDAALAIMQAKARAKWGEFEANRQVFFTWLGVWFRHCADKMRDRESLWTEAPASPQ